MKKVFIVYININIMQDIGDDIESIWFSKRKAEKRKKELIDAYESYREHVEILEREIFK